MINQVLVALDGSVRAPGVFDAAVDIALHFGALLYPFRAIFVPPEFPAAAAGTPADPLPEHLAKEAAEELRRLVAVAHEVKVGSPMVRAGQPWRAILEMGDELDVDLIVLGSHGYRGLDRVLGTTAARVTNLARRNVLVVHERIVRPSSAGAPDRSEGGGGSLRVQDLAARIRRGAASDKHLPAAPFAGRFLLKGAP